MKWHNERRKISDLVPMRNNPRLLTEKQAKDLRRSLKKFDLVEVPAINTDDTIIAGHQRLKIMAMLGRGDEEIDVRVPDRLLTSDEINEYCIRSNKNTGEWNFEILANEFKIDELLDWGFSENELSIDASKLIEEENADAIDLESQYKIIVDCKNEMAQADLLLEFEKRGIKCKALIA